MNNNWYRNKNPESVFGSPQMGLKQEELGKI